jgi:hypothetical protein
VRQRERERERGRESESDRRNEDVKFHKMVTKRQMEEQVS